MASPQRDIFHTPFVFIFISLPNSTFDIYLDINNFVCVYLCSSTVNGNSTAQAGYQTEESPAFVAATASVKDTKVKASAERV